MKIIIISLPVAVRPLQNAACLIAGECRCHSVRRRKYKRMAVDYCSSDSKWDQPFVLQPGLPQLHICLNANKNNAICLHFFMKQNKQGSKCSRLKKIHSCGRPELQTIFTDVYCYRVGTWMPEGKNIKLCIFREKEIRSSFQRRQRWIERAWQIYRLGCLPLLVKVAISRADGKEVSTKWKQFNRAKMSRGDATVGVTTPIFTCTFIVQ